MADNFLEPEDDQTIPLVEPTERMPGLAGYIRAKFEDAENGRYVYEQRWLQAYKNFRGIYDSTTQYRDSERSKVFIKITKTKVLAAYGQIVDILFANKKFPLVVESTPMPEGIAEFAHMRTPADEINQEQSDPYGFPGDGRELAPGAMSASNPHVLGSYGKEFGDMIVPGKAKVGEPQFEPAKEQARLMEKCIHDQLLDTNAVNVFRKAIFESALLGTGIVKGPFNFHKRVHNWERDEGGERTYNPYEKTVPRIEAVSVWDFHPDPSATTIEDCEYVIERHRMNRSQLRSLIMRPHFDAEAIRECLAKGPNYEDKYYEDTIREDETEPYVAENRYEVLEYWGVLDSKFANEVGMEEARDMSEFDQIQVNVWVCGNMVLRCVVNPFTPARIPYQAFPFEINPYQVWGVGVAENMEDAQMLMNGHVRMVHGQTGVTGTGRTAAGLSMLMGSAGLSMKTVIKNIDDHLLKPLGEAYFQWNMQFNEDAEDVKGDLEIKPRGVAAVMQKEVRTQRLTSLLQTVANPMLAPFVKIPNLMRELAIAQDIDPDSLVNDVNEAQVYAQMLQGMMQDAQQAASAEAGGSPPQQGMAPNGGVPSGPPGGDDSGRGNGTIGVGVAPNAGEAGFTGNAPQVEE